MKKHWSDKLPRAACEDAVAWCRAQPSAFEAWENCQRGDWMLWLIERIESTAEDRRTRALCVLDCALLAAHHATPEGQTVIALVDTLIRDWATGGSTTLEDLGYAADSAAEARRAAVAAEAAGAAAADAAAYAAEAAADAAAYAAAAAAAAEAAADAAAYAAEAAAEAAADAAAYAAEAAADAAAYAAYAADAARQTMLADCADIVREYYPQPPEPR